MTSRPEIFALGWLARGTIAFLEAELRRFLSGLAARRGPHLAG